jgi:acyl carrier protein
MREQISSLVKAAVSDLNEELQYQSLADLSEQSVIFGGEDGIDSLSLVRLVVDIEQRLKEDTGNSASLTDERAMSAKRSPYRTVGALTDFIVERLGQ